MTDAELDLIRTVVAYRLIGLPVSYIAPNTRITQAAVKRILLRYGDVPPRGPRARHWKGAYEITLERHKWFAFPDYIPLHIDGVSFQITNHSAWKAMTRDDIYIRGEDGSLRSWGDGKSQPFHKADGAQYETPQRHSWAN